MIFTLEALQARHGDALLVHAGEGDDVALIVIDCGPSGVYGASVEPRLEELRSSGDPEEPLQIDMLMVSHLDDDHIHGVVDMLEDLSQRLEDREFVPYSIQTLWLNHFDGVAGEEDLLAQVVDAVHSASVAYEPREESIALAASVPQCRSALDLARKLKLDVNPAPFDGLVLSDEGGEPSVSLGGGLELRVLGPNRSRLADLQKKWDEVMRKARKDRGEALAQAAEYLDKSVFNLSSIVVLAEAGPKTMLLTGDARGDDTIEALDNAGLLSDGPLHVDVLKLPHHGSSRNVDDGYFENIVADHYVISADGKYGNPDLETLKMLSKARGKDEFVIHLTNKESRLTKFFDAEQRAGKRYEVDYRPADSLSLQVELGDPIQI